MDVITTVLPIIVTVCAITLYFTAFAVMQIAKVGGVDTKARIIIASNILAATLGMFSICSHEYILWSINSLGYATLLLSSLVASIGLATNKNNTLLEVTSNLNIIANIIAVSAFISFYFIS